jgi:polysaccharide biosynthesis/export protein
MVQATVRIKTMTIAFRLMALALFGAMTFANDVLAQPAPTAQAAKVVDPAKAPIKPYTINTGDEVEIYVWGEDRLQRVVRILPDGTFAFPLVGRILAAGKLPSAIETEITEGLKPQYRGEVPQVTVSVRAPSGLQFSVIGRVKGPGTFTPGRYVNVIEALALAGGPDEFANLDNVSIVRKSGNTIRTIKARLSAAFKGARDLTTDSIPQIEGGDTVIVP